MRVADIELVTQLGIGSIGSVGGSRNLLSTRLARLTACNMSINILKHYPPLPVEPRNLVVDLLQDLLHAAFVPQELGMNLFREEVSHLLENGEVEHLITSLFRPLSQLKQFLQEDFTGNQPF